MNLPGVEYFKMIIYSVTILVKNSRVHEWLEWMKIEHIPEIMSTGLFLSYRIMKEISQSLENDETKFIVNYELENKENYDNYTLKFAASLQRKHTEKFSGYFEAARTVLEVINS